MIELQNKEKKIIKPSSTMYFSLTIVICIAHNSRLWGEGFPQEWAVQVVTGPVRRPVRVIFITEWDLVAVPSDGLLETACYLWICSHRSQIFSGNVTT